jgi:hypothetical protein
LSRAASRRQALALWRRHPWARSAFAFDACRFRLVNRFEPTSVASYTGQKCWFARRFQTCVLLVQKGWEYELVDAAGQIAGKPAPAIPVAHLPRIVAALVEKAIEHGLQSLKSTQQQIKTVSSMLIQAGASVTDVSSGVSNIAASVDEQSKGSHEIARHIKNIAQMTEENYAAIEHVGQDILRLEKLAGDMEVAVAHFKV